MKKSITFFILLISLKISSAQNLDSTYSFSIKQAIDFSLKNQKDVVNAQLDEDIAKYKMKEVVGIGLPQVNASFDLKDYEKIPTQFLPDFISPAVYNILYNENLISTQKETSGQLFPVQFGTRWNATAGISASQLLFDPAYLIGVKASKTFKELASKNYSRTKIETAYIVTKAYYTALLLRERKIVIDANLKRFQNLLYTTNALFENGFVEKIDRDRIQVQLNNIETESANFERLIDISDKTLKFQIGLPHEATLILTDSIDSKSIKNYEIPVQNIEPSKRIEYSILKSQESLQQFNLKRYKSEYLPSLIAYGSLNTMAQRTEFTIFKSGYPWYPTGFIGATVNLKIFDGLQRESHIREERLALRKINNEVANFENAINLEVNSSKSSLIYAIAALNIQEKNLEFANSVSSITKTKYDQGVGSNLEVLDAETSLKEAQVNYFNALFNAVIAKMELDKALGNFTY